MSIGPCRPRPVRFPVRIDHMSLLLLRAAILAQGAAPAPPIDTGTAWELDVTRRPAGYTLSDGNQTAVNTAGGANYMRWVPAAQALHP
jgi:hypothetical protein